MEKPKQKEESNWLSRHSKWYQVVEYVSRFLLDVCRGKQAFEARSKANPQDAVAKLLSIVWPEWSGTSEATTGRSNIAILFALGWVRVWVLNRSASFLHELTSLAYQGNRQGILALLKRAGYLLAAGAATSALLEHQRDSLAIAWREKVTRLIHEEYFKLINFYSIGNLPGRKAIVDPEERLSREVLSVTRRLANIVSLIARSVPAFAFFAGSLWRLKGLRYALLPLSYFMLAFEVAQRLFPKNLGILYRDQAAAVGGYFKAVSRVRVHGEAIAALGGAAVEDEIVSKRFAGVSGAQRAVHHALSKFGLIFKLAYTYGSRTWISCLLMQPLLSRAADSVSSQMAELKVLRQYMIEMLVAHGDVMTTHANVQHMGGTTYRVVSLLDTVKALTEAQDRQTSATMETGDRVAFENVQVYTPTKVHLVKDLSFSVTTNDSLLLTGHNGAGKSSIFRCLGGLWDSKGRIVKPALAQDIFYLPQKPYNVLGTLVDQLTYPISAKETTIDAESISELLELVDLTHLSEKYGTHSTEVVNWEEKLSLGEQQRLAMARLFFHKPKFAILDECTSAIPFAMEELLYLKCTELGIAYITICHRPALKRYHSHNLNLTGDGKGGWELHDIRNTQDLTPSSQQAAARAKGSSSLRDGDAKLALDPREVSRQQQLQEERSTEYKSEAQERQKHLEADASKSRSAFSRLKTLMGIVLPGSKLKLASLLAAIGLRTVTHEASGYLSGALMSAVIARQVGDFVRLALCQYGLDVVSAFVEEGVGALQNDIAVTWNAALAKHTSALFFRDSTFYCAHALDRRISDADQRLTQEVQELADSLASLWTHAITPLVDVGFFSYRLYSTVGAEGVLPLAAYVAGSWLVTAIALPDHKALNTKEKELESRFRFIHGRLRTHAESIAFFDGGSREKDIADNALNQLIEHQNLKLRQNLRYKSLFLLVNKDFDEYSGFVRAPDLVTCWMQTEFASDHSSKRDQDTLVKGNAYLTTATDRVLNGFGRLSNLAEDLSSLLGSSARVVQMMDVFEDMHRSGLYSDSRMEGDASANEIALEHVDLVTPTGVCLASDVNLSVEPGKSLMVTGQTAGGKTSLFRVLAGLWPARGVRAHVTRPLRSKLMLVPQRAYSVSGTLRDQVTYPNVEVKGVDDRVRAALEAVGIGYLPDRGVQAMDSKSSAEACNGLDWTARFEDTLSLGEQQRMGLARIIYHKPAFCVIDEATDAVSADQEVKLYETLHDMGVTCITMSKRLNLPQFHDAQVTFGVANEKGYEYTRIFH